MTKRLIGVGVGPGDPELVTVKAVRVLREADVVLVPVLAGPIPDRRTRQDRRTRRTAEPAGPPNPPDQAGPRRSSALMSARTGSSAWSSR